MYLIFELIFEDDIKEIQTASVNGCYRLSNFLVAFIWSLFMCKIVSQYFFLASHMEIFLSIRNLKKHYKIGRDWNEASINISDFGKKLDFTNSASLK